VEFLGFVAEPSRLAALLATADVVIAPGPVETFGLAALEALASGTPVVANSASALPEVLGAAGRAAAGTPEAFADAIEALLDGPRAEQRRTARARAERFPWTATVTGFLAAHGIAATNDRRHHEPAAGRERTPEGGRPRRQSQLR
jgi:alpha-1,6-mannosyltransferase